MKIIGFIIFIIFTHSEIFSQCIQEPRYFDLDNSIDTIELSGRCGNPLDEPETDFLEPDKFGYFKNFNDFLIDCGFTKNCARAAYLTIQANDTSINIFKHEVDTGEATTCEAYERFVFWFPLSSRGFFHISINGFDTIIDGLTSTIDLNTFNQQVYPNPCDNELTIEANDYSKLKTVKIMNLSGEVIYCNDVKTDIHKINTLQLKKGIYFLQITDRETRTILITRKIIKN